ncbi:MAG: HAMP domain-containing histidine kinase, partial [Treponema sp.]|nr:HAMP domain-containing histidine kinase [Treponema sp.]
NVRTSSGIAAFAAWLLLSVLSVFIIWQLRDRARLIRDNDNERILNILFAGMRNYDGIGALVQSNPLLYGRIIGIAAYENSLLPADGWGKFPPVFDEALLPKTGPGRFGRYTIPDRGGHSVKFVLHNERGPRPGEHGDERQPAEYGDEARPGEHDAEPRQSGRWPQGRQVPLFFSILSQGGYFYIDISHPGYWRILTISAVVLPLWELALLFLVFYIRHLYLRNREYRGRIEAQRNLVVLGTAAGTLAHEIKNPLLSIRLQTGILEKLGHEGEEIQIINQEVDRLSALIDRVTDYLREPEGNRKPLNIYDLLAETSRRICGRDIVSGDSARDACILADEDRIRSVLENLLRNALESGSPPEEIGASVGRDGEDGGGKSGAARGAVIRIFDRGRGIEEKNLKRIFDPFFTSKSTGTGIGLAVSRRFTEAAGGSVRVENREGGGLMVILVFPDYNETVSTTG